MVLAWQEIDSLMERKPYIFRSYKHPNMGNIPKQRNPEARTTWALWKIARATSAAPFYFQSVTLDEDDPKLHFIDGGLGANNPSVEAWESIKQLNRGDPKTVDINVSVGTGRMLDSKPKKASRSYVKKQFSFVKHSFRWPTTTHPAHEDMSQRAQDHGFKYYRLNVKNGFSKMDLDAWKGRRGIKTLEKLRTETQAYLNSREAQDRLIESARYLFQKRQDRSSHADRDHWERFCHGVEYYCRITPYNDHGYKYRERRDLRRHLQEMHPHCDNTEMWLDQGKRYPDTRTAD